MDRESLVAGLKAGDEMAWGCFLSEFGPLIYAMAGRLRLTRTDKDDLFQDTCITIVGAIDTLKDPYKLGSWVSTIVYRQGIDTLRRRRPEVSIEEIGEFPAEATSGEEDPSILTELQKSEESAWLLDRLAQLDERCRRLLSALYLEEPRPSYSEIGRREGMPVGSIGPIRARCLKRLKNNLGPISKRPVHPSNYIEGD